MVSFFLVSLVRPMFVFVLYLFVFVVCVWFACPLVRWCTSLALLRHPLADFSASSRFNICFVFGSRSTPVAQVGRKSKPKSVT